MKEQKETAHVSFFEFTTWICLCFQFVCHNMIRLQTISSARTAGCLFPHRYYPQEILLMKQIYSWKPYFSVEYPHFWCNLQEVMFFQLVILDCGPPAGQPVCKTKGRLNRVKTTTYTMHTKASSRVVFGRVTRQTRWPRVVRIYLGIRYIKIIATYARNL